MFQKRVYLPAYVSVCLHVYSCLHVSVFAVVTKASYPPGTNELALERQMGVALIERQRIKRELLDAPPIETSSAAAKMRIE